MKYQKPQSRHPIQPLVQDEQGAILFKSNSIVRYLLDKGGIDMNQLARVEFPREDWQQFYQLIGYSHSGIPDCDAEIWEAAEEIYKAGVSELEARNNYLRDELDALKAGLREPIARLYNIHEDDLKV